MIDPGIKKTRAVRDRPRLIEGKFPKVLECDLDCERFLLSVLLVVFIFVTAAAAGAGTCENGADGERGENRCN